MASIEHAEPRWKLNLALAACVASLGVLQLYLGTKDSHDRCQPAHSLTTLLVLVLKLEP